MPDAGAGGDAPRWSQAPRIRIRTHPQAATPACSQRPVRSLSRAAVGSRRQRLDHAGNTATQLVTFSPVTSWVAVLTSPSRRSRSGRRAAATCPARRHLAAPTRDVPGRARPARCPPVSATYDAGPAAVPCRPLTHLAVDQDAFACSATAPSNTTPPMSSPPFAPRRGHSALRVIQLRPVVHEGGR